MAKKGEKKRKLVLMTCIHGRHNITSAFFIQRAYLEEELKMEIPIAFAYTEDEDLENLLSQQLVRNYDKYKQTDNYPLSEKHNVMLDRALEYNSEKVMHVGSNDLVSAEYVQMALESDYEWVGVNEMYVHSLSRNRSIHMRYGTGKRLLGSGRVFSSKLLKSASTGLEYRVRRPYYNLRAGDVTHIPDAVADKLLERSVIERTTKKARKTCLWFKKINRGLDNASDEVIASLGYKQVNVSQDFDEPQIAGLSSGEDLTPFDRHRGAEVSPEFLVKIAPEIDFEQ